MPWASTSSGASFVDMKRRALGFLAGAVLIVPLGAIAKALHFGGFGWLVLLVALMFFVSLFDREYFYGPRDESG